MFCSVRSFRQIIYAENRLIERLPYTKRYGYFVFRNQSVNGKR